MELKEFVPPHTEGALIWSHCVALGRHQLISTLVGHDWFWHDFVTKLYSLVMDCVRFPWPTKNFGSSQRKFLQGGALDAKVSFFWDPSQEKK